MNSAMALHLQGLCTVGWFWNGYAVLCPLVVLAQKRQRWGSARESRRTGIYQQKAIPGYQTCSARKSPGDFLNSRLSWAEVFRPHSSAQLSNAVSFSCSEKGKQKFNCVPKGLLTIEAVAHNGTDIPSPLGLSKATPAQLSSWDNRYSPPHLRQQPCFGSSWTEEVAGDYRFFHPSFLWLAWTSCMMAAYQLWRGE